MEDLLKVHIRGTVEAMHAQLIALDQQLHTEAFALMEYFRKERMPLLAAYQAERAAEALA